MAVQQNKVSKSRRDKRRAHDGLAGTNADVCANCGEEKRPHHVCPSCGYYRGREVAPPVEESDYDDDAA